MRGTFGAPLAKDLVLIAVLESVLVTTGFPTYATWSDPGCLLCQACCEALSNYHHHHHHHHHLHDHLGICVETLECFLTL